MVLRATLMAAALAMAPFQCASEPDPTAAVEERPGEALYRLAQEFKEHGNVAAWRHTLGYLVARYPTSRFAVMAQRDLEEDDPAKE